MSKISFVEPFIGNIKKPDVIYWKEDSFTKLYNSLICETYNIFPVPRLLINDMLSFVLTHKSLEQKSYSCQDILNNYIFDWKYYNQFKENIKLMLKENIDCSITLILFESKHQLLEILKKYPNQDIKDNIVNQSDLPNGIAYTYSNDFNVCLAINLLNKDQFHIHKTLQHELIHWMQTSLNSHSGKSYGVFPELKITLNPIQKSVLYQLGVDPNYVLSKYEFEPWVANTCEEFTLNKFTVEEYISIIENDSKFIETISNCNSHGLYEMLVFGKVCYIVSKTPKDDYYYYLIEALKEN